jgi:hypothetical protein
VVSTLLGLLLALPLFGASAAVAPGAATANGLKTLTCSGSVQSHARGERNLKRGELVIYADWDRQLYLHKMSSEVQKFVSFDGVTAALVDQKNDRLQRGDYRGIFRKITLNKITGAYDDYNVTCNNCRAILYSRTTAICQPSSKVPAKIREFFEYAPHN